MRKRQLARSVITTNRQANRLPHLLIGLCLLRAAGAETGDNKVKPGELIVDHPTLINLGFEWLIQGGARLDWPIFRHSGGTGIRRSRSIVTGFGRKSTGKEKLFASQQLVVGLPASSSPGCSQYGFP